MAYPVVVDAATNGWFHQHSTMVTTCVFRTLELQTNPVGVPANGVVVIPLTV
jgi:hypothetical protein